jgi:putative transposase
MYEYRRLTPEERDEVVQQRLAKGNPPHSPPHPARGDRLYLLTAACYEHVSHMTAQARRQQVLDLLLERFTDAGFNLHGWVVLANHYHILGISG